MSCSPLLEGVTDPLEVLRVVSEHHILRFSEPSGTFYPLAELGWVTYRDGAWGITESGYRALEQEPDSKPMDVNDLFGI